MRIGKDIHYWRLGDGDEAMGRTAMRNLGDRKLIGGEGFRGSLKSLPDSVSTQGKPL